MSAQNMPSSVPPASEWTLDAAGPVQRKAISSVYLITCARTLTRGTGFLLTEGWIVTNHHVIQGCDAKEIVASSAFGKEVYFRSFVSDENRDLALLVPQKKIDGGLVLGTDKGLALGTQVNAWGFPVVYDGPSPILSVGYIAGFNAHHPNPNTTVKHLVVNGAFNPGNSGGPILLPSDGKVIGIVVWKRQLVADWIPIAISALLLICLFQQSTICCVQL